MKKITWQRMLELSKLNIAPLSFTFILHDPIDRSGDICFRQKEVVSICGKLALVVGGENEENWLAKDASEVWVKAD